MGTVFKKTYTKPVPPEAETFTRKGQRLAKWKDGKNKTRTAPLTIGKDGSDRILVKAGTYTAKYRDVRCNGGEGNRLPGRNGRSVSACRIGAASGTG